MKKKHGMVMANEHRHQQAPWQGWQQRQGRGNHQQLAPKRGGQSRKLEEQVLREMTSKRALVVIPEKC
jgi:hypothetical protein